MRILDTLLEISIYATAIFAATMLVKRLLKDRLSPLLHYAIWSLFILRLMLPVTFDSPVRLFTLPAPPAAAVAGNLSQGDGPRTQAGAQPGKTATEPQAAAGAARPTQTAPKPVGTFGAEGKRALSVPAVLAAVWLSGVGIGLMYLSFLYIRLQKRIRKHAVKPAKRLCALYRQVLLELDIRKDVPLACQYGLTSPGILFPACVLMPMEALTAMDDEQVKNTLRHELVHYKRGDHIASILLSVLCMVYWFHPIVWIAARQIRADMETACDSRVVTGMSATEKGDYASLILELFSRTKYRQVVLGMAYGKSKAVIEKRIKGVFMNHQSRWSAKIICCSLALVMLIGCFTTACVPETREAADVSMIGGADGPTEIFVSDGAASAVPHIAGQGAAAAQELLDAAGRTATVVSVSGGPLAEKLGVPAHWGFAEKSTDGKLTLHADIGVTLPNAAAIPIARATCREVTEADLMNVATLFFGPDVTFSYAAQDTKEYAEAYLERSRELYTKIRNGTNENMIPSFVKSVTEQYEAYEKLAETAPSAAENLIIEPVFTEHVDVRGDSYMGFRGVATRNGTKYYVSAANLRDASAVNIMELHENGDHGVDYLGTYRREPEGLSVAREEAVLLATAMAEKIDSGLSLSHVMAAGLPVSAGEENTWEHPWAWKCVFMRELNGAGTIYDSRDVGSDIESNVDGRAYEALEIAVDERGVCNIHWMNPMTVDEVMEPDAELLPFAEIAAKLPDLVRERYDYNITREANPEYNVYPTSDLYVQSAELGLMRVGSPGAVTYTLEPVWSFFIDFSEQPDYSERDERAAYMGDPVRCNSLTLSAVDGRVIDRDRGE